MAEDSGIFLCPKCGKGISYKKWIKKDNKYIFSKYISSEERWTNAEYEKTRKERIDANMEAIDSINSQFMTLNASERAEDCEPYEKAIEEINANYKTYYKDSPSDLMGSTIEAWDTFYEYKWECWKCYYTSPTFLDFIPKKNK